MPTMRTFRQLLAKVQELEERVAELEAAARPRPARKTAAAKKAR